MAEATYEGIVVDAAIADGWIARKLKWIGRRNGPDRFFAKDGRVVLMEFKRPGESARTGQDKEITALSEAGVEVHVVDSHLKALRILGVRYAAA